LPQSPAFSGVFLGLCFPGAFSRFGFLRRFCFGFFFGFFFGVSFGGLLWVFYGFFFRRFLFVWVCLGLFGSVWVCLGLFGFALLCSVLFGLELLAWDWSGMVFWQFFAQHSVARLASFVEIPMGGFGLLFQFE
jgi:hypothetical protein